MAEDDTIEGYIEELIECPFCGGFVPDEFECIKCGEEILNTDLDVRTKTVCSRCGSEVKEDADQCSNCGAVF